MAPTFPFMQICFYEPTQKSFDQVFLYSLCNQHKWQDPSLIFLLVKGLNPKFGHVIGPLANLVIQEIIHTRDCYKTIYLQKKNEKQTTFLSTLSSTHIYTNIKPQEKRKKKKETRSKLWRSQPDERNNGVVKIEILKPHLLLAPHALDRPWYGLHQLELPAPLYP